MSYHVWIKLDDVCISIPVHAGSLEGAIEKGKQLDMRKDILAKGIEWIDGHFVVTGVHTDD
jgi:hypothetical protein